MPQARRSQINAILGDAKEPRIHPREIHAGLWWEKYLPVQRDKKGQSKEGADARQSHIAALAGHSQPQGYWQAFARWRKHLDENQKRGLCLTAPAEALGRLILGIGDKGPLEVGLRFDHTWGVPILPGSGLKGLAASAAHNLLEDEEWRKGGDLHRFVFGSTEETGAICFLDAWWIPPKEATTLPIHPDVMTVHHADYYQESPVEHPPSDTDSPNPVSFATTNGSYLIAVEAREGLWTRETVQDRDAWMDIALTILRRGLKELGLGAKTNSGYGRMDLGPFELADQRQRARRVAALSPEDHWIEDHADLLASEEQEQGRWLMTEARKVPASFESGLSWRKHLNHVLARGRQQLQDQLDRDPREYLTELEGAHSTLSSEPPSGKGKQKQKWRRKKEKLERQIQEELKSVTEKIARQKHIQELLDWLET